MDWPHLLVYITGRVDQELLLRNEYLGAENRILRAKFKGRLQLSDGEKSTLAEIARRLGRKALAEVAVVATPDTILRWFRKFVARKFDGSRFRPSVGRLQVDPVIENLIVRMARENRHGATIASSARLRISATLCRTRRSEILESSRNPGSEFREHSIPGFWCSRIKAFHPDTKPRLRTAHAFRTLGPRLHYVGYWRYAILTEKEVCVGCR